MFLSVAVTGSSLLAAATTGAGNTDASPAAAAPAAAVWPNSRRAILSKARFPSGGGLRASPAVERRAASWSCERECGGYIEQRQD